MTNIERQRSLDKKKYLESERQGMDLSGKMFYCNRCDYQYGNLCTVTQNFKDKVCPCATAFNRGQRV